MILLSFCDGIGSARLALEWLVGPPRATIAWEVDEECIKVTKHWFPEVHHRGCFIDDDYTAVANLVKEYDPDHQCTIVVAAGTPCPDYSVVSAKSEGRKQPEGAKFGTFIEKVKGLNEALPDHKFLVVAENVVMNDPSDCQYISDKMGADPIVLDSADCCMVSRPRLWWANVQWPEVKDHPLTGEKIQWSQFNGHRQIKLALPRQDVANFAMGGMKFHDEVTQGRKHIPCFTTPSPDPQGRPPPQKHRLKTSEAARQRWLADNRQFAPWHYNDHAMAWRGDEAVVIPPDVKEQLHNFPRGFTRVEGVAHRSRHRMLANSWHMSSALVILAFILQWAHGQAATMPRPPCQSAIQQVIQVGNCTMARPGPHFSESKEIPMRPCRDMWDHWEAAYELPHPGRMTPRLEPGLEATFQTYSMCWKQLNGLREAVIREVQQMIVDWQEVTEEWFRSLPLEIQTVYTTNGRKRVTQVPVLIELLRQAGYQGVDQLQQELTRGFNMTGELTPGTGWLPRTDDRYMNPISRDQFHQFNAQYVKQKLENATPSLHWLPMLEELLEEEKKGRVEGPLQAPHDWGVRFPAVQGATLRPAPTEHARAAMCFAVVQSDKVRRCEDYRRSSHNATVLAYDCPHYNDVECYAALVRRLQTLDQGTAMVWGQDLAGAYRQLPVEPGGDTYTLLFLPDGPSLWRHRAAPFGAVASVWAFCRFGDALTSLARRLLVVLTGHFVDDWTGVELPATAASSCSSFKTFFEHLGLDMKPEKEQPPATSQKVLGVIFEVTDEMLLVAICPKRRDRLLKTLEDLLINNWLTPEEAQHISGKLGFMATTLFGGIGRAAIQPFYSRAHSVGDQRNPRLTFALRAAINTLKQLLVESRPRSFPWTSQDSRTQAVIYSDAFFQVGERMMKPADAPELWSPVKKKPKSNGWGFVVRVGEKVTYAHGELPTEFIEKFTTRRAFIYMMEILAAVMAVVFTQIDLPPFFIMFVDNQAGRSALEKGYGNDPRVNAIITAFWTLTAHKGWFPKFKYVQSALNISDPISRHETSMAESAGWSEIQVNDQALLVALESFAQDSSGSISKLLDDLLALQRTPSGLGSVHGVVKYVHTQPQALDQSQPPS